MGYFRGGQTSTDSPARWMATATATTGLDIGADERFAVTDVLHVQATPERATAGASTQVLAVIANPSATTSQTGVVFESIVPEGMVFVPGSLYAFSGDVNVASEGAIERVVWTGDLPAENAATIRYDLPRCDGRQHLRVGHVAGRYHGRQH